jgi:hypothetical protein
VRATRAGAGRRVPLPVIMSSEAWHHLRETAVICSRNRGRERWANRGVGVKQFALAHLLPLVSVVLTIAVLTLALFEVPTMATPPVFGLRVVASAEPIASSASVRAHVDDTLTRVLRALDDGRRDTVAQRTVTTTDPAHPMASASKPLALQGPALALQAPTPAPTADTKLLDAVSALGDAVRAIHEARSEDDLLHAEDLVRNAREQMESSCATSSGPLCSSAAQIRSLGY